MTDSVDPVLTEIEGYFKTLLWDNLVKAALARMFELLPWLAVWPLGPIVNAVLGHFVENLFATLIMNLDLAAIAFKNAEHEKTYTDKLVELKIIAHDRGVNSDEFKQARDQAALALSALTQFNR